uniref:LRRC37A/B like protein 1 C-terminal domain-containing protein n=1 Tax=Taeniopygia guttata TaxID=59729 RepID=A0A674HFL4_TAEGU
MQFLQELILSHNPLAVIADAAFFKLPSVSSLDLSATQVTPQTLLLLLQSTVSLETLQVPKEAACCLCQERPRPESPCRTIQFLCQKLCSTSAPQCAHTTALEARGESMDMEQRRELNSSPVLSLKPKEPSLGDDGTVMLAVALALSTEGDVSSLDSSRPNSYPPPNLLGHEGQRSADDLRAKLKRKVHKAEGIKTVESIVPHQPQPAWLKHVVGKAPSSWDHKQQEAHLNWQAINPWDVAGGLNPNHYNSLDQPLRYEVEGQSPQQNSIMSIKEQQGSRQKQMDSRLNWQILNPWYVAGGLNPNDDDSSFGHHRDKEKDPAPRQNYVNSHKQPKEWDSQYWVGHNQLFYQVLSPVNAEQEPRATDTKDEQRLNRNLDFLSDLLVQSHPAARRRGGAMAGEEHSSIDSHLLITSDTTDTHWKQEEEGSRFLNKPWSPQSPDLAPVHGELLETTADRLVRLLVPDKSLQMFMAHVERALRMDCSLPQLKQACAKMVSKIGLLLKVLSVRQGKQGASDGMGRCPLQENIYRHTALEEDQETTEKPKPETMDETIPFVVLLSVIAVILLILKGVFHVCSRCAAPVCQQLFRRKSWLRRFCIKLPQRGRKDKKEAQNVEQNRAGSPSECCSCFPPIHGASQCCSPFTKSELLWIQRIRDAYEDQRKASQEDTEEV